MKEFLLVFEHSPYVDKNILRWSNKVSILLFCRNYEHIVKAHQNNPQQGSEQVSDQVKFSVFQSIMDSLFQSFSASVSVSSFQELSACVFSWIEEHCKPKVLMFTHLIPIKCKFTPLKQSTTSFQNLYVGFKQIF